MFKVLQVILLASFVSCGFKVETDDIKSTSTVGPDFESAAKFCDKRYGFKSEEAELCFKDYRDYFSVDLNVKFDFEGITSFCNESFSAESDIDNCTTDLLSILTGLIPPQG